MGSVSVRVTEGNILVLKWSFFNTEPYTCLTYADLLKKLIQGNDICKDAHLQFATASSTFNCVEEIQGGPTVNLIDIIKSFGMRFFTLHICFWHSHSPSHVSQHEGECECQKQTEKPAVRNAFDVMMESARRVASDDVPVPITETTNWEKLHNVVLQYCLNSGSTFPSNTGSFGKTFIKHLTSLFWYLDGQYDDNDSVSKDNSVSATIVKKFSGFNLPQLHKHRKETGPRRVCQVNVFIMSITVVDQSQISILFGR
jgi:hypothetical protein